MAKKSAPVLSRANLWSLEEYAKRRPTFQPEVMAHKKNRTVHLGNHLTLQFEDEMTVRYQIQEMLHNEATDHDSVQSELDAYLPLIPDGSNFKATMTLDYTDDAEKKRQLAQLIGIEDRVWIQVEGSSKLYSIADEDVDRENDYGPSTVHFLRFELTKEMKAALKYGVGLAVGVDHPRYKAAINPLPQTIRNALVADLK
ncbi:MAG TPA: DUF3501 family protein [Casimicrobium huifangae]|jgi:hypothetical protein|uniref:DUF3501 family protein n=1 Tax=Casimicrobium huifangae TaxID=2591109 RepID=UPI0012EC143D|nr:DUF3501 family protein [Casimicrobium huifangae]HOB00585.1 DUF3501 family protein [Casimicrobium huifangae]HQA33486.1 DUF3501 family protein [Casimicrobium huifangae]HQD65086.1 DUF3501 family protein [Casimicrobium huifangae]